jgi:hypothetical protein
MSLEFGADVSLRIGGLGNMSGERETPSQKRDYPLNFPVHNTS